MADIRGLRVSGPRIPELPPHARDLWGVARHLKCNITVLFHSLRGGKMLSPFIRASLNVITVFFRQLARPFEKYS